MITEQTEEENQETQGNGNNRLSELSDVINGLATPEVDGSGKYSLFRQTGALFAKHKLEWVRTPFQSYCEVLFPVLLFTIAALLRVQVVPQGTDWTLDSFKNAAYPVGKMVNETWHNNDFIEKQQFQQEI